jgi:hypothetical protein
MFFILLIIFYFKNTWIYFKLAHNVLRLGDVAEIEAQMFSFAQKFNRKTELEFSTSAAILTNRC